VHYLIFVELNLLRVTSLNVNGLRSAFRKGLHPWMEKHGADVICLQELKAQEADLEPALTDPAPYQGHFHFAQKRATAALGSMCGKRPKRS